MPHSCLSPFLSLGFTPHLPHNPRVICSASPDLFPLLLIFCTHFWKEQKDRAYCPPPLPPRLRTARTAGEASPWGGREQREWERCWADYSPLFSACKSSAELLNWSSFCLPNSCDQMPPPWEAANWDWKLTQGAAFLLPSNYWWFVHSSHRNADFLFKFYSHEQRVNYIRHHEKLRSFSMW